MKQLHNIETKQERIRLQTETQAEALIKRYYESRLQSLVLKKQI